MSKLSSTFFTLALLLSFMLLTHAARPVPEQEGVSAENVEAEENCEGAGAEECLVRRTLVAHLDYIYTQKHNP